RDALAAAARASCLITERGSWRIVERGDVVCCAWSWGGPPSQGHALSNEVMVSAFARGIRELSGAPPRCIHFAHRAPPVRGEHEALLEGPVRFGEPDTAVLISRARLGVAPRAASLKLHRFLCDLVAGEIEALGPSAVRERAARLLARRLRDDGQLPAL